jgi:CcmD family protein
MFGVQNAEFLIAAYTIIFVVLVGYSASLLRRRQALRRELEAAQKTLHQRRTNDE